MVEYKDRLYLYAPLRGVLAETNWTEIEEFDRQLTNGVMPDALIGLCGGVEPQGCPQPEALSEITILMNQKCNFACRYCYSANGRSRAELPSDLFDTIVDWFVTPERLSRSESDHLSVTFSGGGDPMLSFESIETLILKLRAKASAQGIPLKVGLVCNGSMVKDDYVDFMARNVDDIVISFDVIEEIHDAQRSHYGTVARTIHHLCGKGLRPGLRSTITSLNVRRMSEMVHTLADCFKDCRSIAMEAVLAPDMWQNGTELKEFYTAFVENYYAARRLGEKLGISVGNTIDICADGLKSRACVGKLSISPDGTLTACSRVATPGDLFYDDFTFGVVKNNCFEIDNHKYNKIMDVRADKFAECRSCFARYHCGGGCMLARLSNSATFMNEYCRFVKAMTINSLIYEMD